MDSLTRSLIKPFLPESIDGKEVTAVFGGGFKPPTAGHLSVIQKALQDHPEIDNVVIYVGGKVRDGITQDQSFKIWDEHYKTLIDRPVRIEKSVAPIKDIYRYAKDNSEDITYFILGARQGREDDLQDIVNRSKSISKYPNLQLKTISTPDGGMSGTNARNALMSNDKEAFKFFVPSNIDYNEVWNILTSQPINEGDPKVGTGKKPKGSGRRLYTDENPNDTVKVKFSTKQDIIDTLNKASFKSKSHARQSQVINLIHQRVRAAYNRAKDPDVKRRLKSALDYAEQRKEVSKKKTERLKKQKTNEAIDTNFDKVKFYHDYYTNVSPSTFEIVLEENDIRISNIVESYPSNFGPENVRQIPVNQNLEENIDPKSQSKHKGKSSPFGSAYEKVDETGLKIAKKNMDDYKRSNNPSGKKPKDPFGLNQFAREIMQEEELSYDTFDYPKHIKSLTTFMLDKGMKLKPLPTVKFINDDVENAENFFGKTAYYDPNNHRIVLYTLNRHPKDVMRSFAHEMIHHMQNHEGKLETIHTQNTNEEGDLPEIEREAYEKGNMTFRSWTDTITEGVLKENTDEDFRSYKSIFAPGITITVVFKEYEKYNELEPLFKEYGYGFYSPKTKTIIIDGEVFINSDLTFNDLKFVEAHEISHLIMNHSAPRSDKDELEADLGAYILLKSQNLPVDNVKKQFKFRHGIEFDESLLDQVKDKF